MIKCYFDGCCEPKNPFGNMGTGAVILKDNIPVFNNSQFIPESRLNSNNVAEYLALEKILIWLSENEVLENTIFIYGDSNLVINQMRGLWKIKSGLYTEHALRCRKLVSESKLKLVFTWIPREKNTIADDLSKDHLIKNKVEFKIQPL